MSQDVEERVARYLDLREGRPALTPEEFVADLGAERSRVLAAIRRTLEVAELLARAGEPRPDAVGPYRVESELGRGAMGVVYAVERDAARYALKLWSPAWSLGARARERFEREARSLARIDHPGIVRVRDSGIEAGCPYLVMDLVDGEALSRTEVPVAPERAARIVRDLARAVAAAHAAGVLHRDIKPQNVVLARDDRPVLLDFGLVAAEGEATLTATGALLGTPRYMAPEQARGVPTDRRADVYALGLVLYELLYGVPAREQSSSSALLYAAAWNEVRYPRRPAGVDERLERVLRASLAWRPERRIESAELLAGDLERWLARLPVRARPPSWAQRCLDRVRARPARLAAAGAVLAAIVLAVGGALAFADAAGRRSAALARAEAERRTDHALTAWFLGSDDVARHEIAAGLAADPSHPVAAALDLVLRGETPSGSDVGAAVAALADGDAQRGAQAARDARLRHRDLASLAALQVRASSALAQDPALAVAASSAARLEFPRCAALGCLEALARERAGDADGTDAALLGAIALAPESGPLHAERARSLLRRARVAEGVAEAAQAARLHAAAGVDFLVELPRLLALAPDGAAVRAELAARLEREPDDASLWFALAWSCDSAHELAGAERAYRRSLELDPSCVRSALNLAHLYAGAQLGSCRACDEAYAIEPSMLSPAKALDTLGAAIDVDRGRNDYVVGRAVQTALDLERRAPEHGASRLLAAAVERALAAGAPNVAARTRLEEALLRLHTASGD